MTDAVYVRSMAAAEGRRFQREKSYRKIAEPPRCHKSAISVSARSREPDVSSSLTRGWLDFKNPRVAVAHDSDGEGTREDGLARGAAYFI